MSSEQPTPGGNRFPFAILIFGGYALLLLLLLWRHEVWRDEVRAWSLARTASNPLDLISSKLNNEGHPGLWHLLLWVGCQVTDNPVVLKITNYLVVLGFSALFFFLSPFPLLHRCLFLLGFYPLHEYGVVSRNYGIGALLMFLLAVEYSRRDSRLPWRAGLYNALLANTNVYGAFCAVAFLLVPPPTEPNTRQRRLKAWGTVALISVIGLALSAYTFWPRPGNFAIEDTTGESAPGPAEPHPATEPHPAVESHLALLLDQFVAVVNDREAWTCFILTASHWNAYLTGAFPESVVLAVETLTFWGLLGLLLRWPWLLLSYTGAFVASALFSRLIYPAADRHLGMLWAYLLTLLWIALARVPVETRGRSKGLFWLLGLSLLGHAVAGLGVSGDYLREPYTQSKNAGQFLAREYPTATVLGEPDCFLESLPYYSTNPIYIVREQRFHDFVLFTAEWNRPTTRTEMMATADRLLAETKKPVLMALSLTIKNIGRGVYSGGLGRTFTSTGEDMAEFNRRFVEVAAFSGAGAETFIFYKHRDPK